MAPSFQDAKKPGKPAIEDVQATPRLHPALTRVTSQLSTPRKRVAESGSADVQASPRHPTLTRVSSQLSTPRKLFAESMIGRASFQKLLEPSQPQAPGIAPYRVVLGNVKEKVLIFLFIATFL